MRPQSVGSERIRGYVLLTAAHNEQAFIERTIQSVVTQTISPEEWIIVSDNSNDQTEAIVEHYAKQYSFIRLLSFRRPAGRNFGAKIHAWNQGFKVLTALDFDFIGNLDADITLEQDYYEYLLRQFREKPNLGLASGYVCEKANGKFRPRLTNSPRDVPHAAQLIRRECYEAIGGYAVLKYGGEDWYAQTSAQMKGWQVRSFPEIKVFHHRYTGGDTDRLRAQYRLGKLDYSFGSDLLFEIGKCCRRISEKPYIVGAAVRFAGFTSGFFTREARAIPDDAVAYLRRQQRRRISSSFQLSERTSFQQIGCKWLQK